MQEPKEGHAENEMIKKDHRPTAKKEKSGGDWKAQRYRKNKPNMISKFRQQQCSFSFDLAVFTGSFTFGDINV